MVDGSSSQNRSRAAPDAEPRTGPLLHSGFSANAKRFPYRPALDVSGSILTYAELHERAAGIAANLQSATDDSGLVAILASRSVTAYAGVLGILMSGQGYVPLNPGFPASRLRSMLHRSGATQLVVDRERLDLVPSILNSNLRRIIAPDVGGPPPSWVPDPVRWAGADRIPGPQDVDTRPQPARHIAYLLFTSGSTGTPKGVPITHANVVHVLDWADRHFDFDETDRFSQTFDLTFDLSVFDMFVAWSSGGCLCVPSSSSLMAPGSFIREKSITVWFSVPSLAVYMRRLGLLKSQAYPRLRWCLFCGEPLTRRVAEAWSSAAPHARIMNLYGPTEVTIAFTAHEWRAGAEADPTDNGIIPIGRPFPGMQTLIVEDSLQPVSPGQVGELLVSGPQVSNGYWNDEERTAHSFVRPPGTSAIYYRTGDRVRADAEETLRYVGRTDAQVKVNGHRVELGEVEHAVRESAGLEAVVAIPWPLIDDAGAAGIQVFLATDSLNEQALRRNLKERLPAYMIPRRIHALPSLPLNANGKFDRRELKRRLEEGL